MAADDISSLIKYIHSQPYAFQKSCIMTATAQLTLYPPQGKDLHPTSNLAIEACCLKFCQQIHAINFQQQHKHQATGYHE